MPWRLRVALRGFADVRATERGFALSTQRAKKIVVLAPLVDDANADVLAEVAMRMNMPVKQNWQTALKERACSVALN